MYAFILIYIYIDVFFPIKPSEQKETGMPVS